MPTYTPDTYDGPRIPYPKRDTPQHNFWGRVEPIQRSACIWIDTDDEVHAGYPDADETAAHIFYGGRNYVVSDAVGTILTDAGYTVT